jgi:hypothetical protein
LKTICYKPQIAIDPHRHLSVVQREGKAPTAPAKYWYWTRRLQDQRRIKLGLNL